MVKFTKEEKKKLIKVLKKEYNEEQLKEFVAKAIGERMLLILSLDNKDSRNQARKGMLKTLEKLQDIAIKRLNEIQTKKKLKKVV